MFRMVLPKKIKTFFLKKASVLPWMKLSGLISLKSLPQNYKHILSSSILAIESPIGNTAKQEDIHVDKLYSELWKPEWETCHNNSNKHIKRQLFD